MTTLIPAVPPAKLLAHTGEAVAVIIGWQYLTGNYCFPVFAHARTGIRKNEAIQFEDGTVSHPDSKEVFPSSRDWVAFADAENLENQTGEVDGAKAVTEAPKTTAAAPTKPAATATVKPAAPKPAATKPEPKAPPASDKLVFGTKAHKTKSFWHWPDANAVFEIEGENPYPTDPRVAKIKREEFFALKRDGAVAIDPHAGVIQDDDQSEEEDFGDVI